jgi:hypothetical protein
MMTKILTTNDQKDDESRGRRENMFLLFLLEREIVEIIEL